MKLITENEKSDHKSHIMKQGSKGFLIGSVVGLGLIRYFKFKQPLKYNSFNWTIKACLYTMPTLGFTAFLTDNGGTQFFKSRYRSPHLQQEKQVKSQQLDNLSMLERIIYRLNEHKYKLVVGAWAGFLFGAWRVINKDLLLTKTQKLIHARVYAQAFTIGILLSTLYLNMKEVELNNKLPQLPQSWERVLKEKGGL